MSSGADRIWHLQQSSLLEGLSLSDIYALASVCRDNVYPKGEIIFDEDDSADSLFILNRGSVRLSLVNSDGREKILAIFRTGDIFGENVLEPANRFRTQAIAHEESWVSIIRHDQLVHLIQQRTAIAVNYIKILNQLLRQAREDIEAHSFLDVEHRLGKTLLKLATTHGKHIFADKAMVKIKFPLSHHCLARFIGANRPHVSTIMSRFRKQGWIRYQGRKLLVNVNKLEHFTEPSVP